jgi:hypothetical protein
MKKLLLLSMLIILPFSLTGCFKKQAVEAPQPVQEQAQGGIKVNKPNTIMGWLKSGKGTECEMVTPEGDKVTVIAMGDKVKISGFPYADMSNPDSAEEVIGHSLTVGDMMYMWGAKTGMKMDLKKMEQIAEDLGEEANEEEPDTWEDMVSDWDEQNIDYKCTEKRFSDADFTAPSDVEFQDLTAFMEGVSDMGMQLQDSMKEGGEMDLEALQQQAEELKAQYGLDE